MNRSRENEGPMPEQLAYFLTWPTYGSWLPGDERGWVLYRQGFQPADATREFEAAIWMTEDACVLDVEQRKVVEATVREHCRIRGWELHAVNCRSTHIHVVVTADRHPDDVRDQLKAWCTRRLKELAARGHTNPTRKRGVGTRPSRERSSIRERWWAERGSKRFLNDEASLEAAILYVTECQDVPRE
jgi:REP element-mobilizing transposase RayT